MKKLSKELKQVLERASEESKFAQKIIENSDDVIKEYNLTDDEAVELKSFETAKRIVAGQVNLYSIAFAILILILIGSFFVYSVFYPTTSIGLGIPSWDEMSSTIKSIVLIYGVSLFIGSLLFLVKTLGGLPTAKRNTYFIVLTLLIIIPGIIGLTQIPVKSLETPLYLILILIFTILPISFYPLFISTKRQTLWDEFIFNLECLDPIAHQQLRDIYQKKYETLYGPVAARDERDVYEDILSGEKPFPVILNTIIIALGWFLYFFGEVSGTIFDIGGKSPFVFGFLGAYLFSLQMLFRRYLQSDLKTTAYSHSSQRILITWVLALVLTILPLDIGADNTKVQIFSVLTFAVGVFPEIAWQVIAGVLKRTLGLALPTFKQEHPLNKIDGITVWTEARLLEQDIENIQNLVTTNIVDLILETNLDPRRIVDWIDQGILLLHFSETQNKEIQDALYKRGIHTATDLLENYNKYKPGQGAQKDFLGAELDALVAPIVNSIENDPNIYHIKAWRKIKLQLNNKLDDVIKNKMSKPNPG